MGNNPALLQLRAVLSALDPADGPAPGLAALALAECDLLPLPGAGATLQRWQALALVAQHDLSLAKLFEGHTDALAIMAELNAPAALADRDAGNTRTLWGMWAAEAPAGRALIEPAGKGQVVLSGAKCWCSGAAQLSHALLTAWWADGRGPQLVSVAMGQAGVQVDASAWVAVGMVGSASVDVAFGGCAADLIGEPGAYLTRPGFWQGGAGVAACWYGGSLALAQTLRRSLLQGPEAGRSPFRWAALGKVDLSLQGTAAVLRDAALWIDRHPLADASAVALRARLAAEGSARLVLDEAGRALGAAPFCRDARFARAAADLPVFVRQSHAERDFAALGERAGAADESIWCL